LCLRPIADGIGNRPEARARYGPWPGSGASIRCGSPPGITSNAIVTRVDLASGGERPLARLPAVFDIHDFDVAADGSEIVFDHLQARPDLALIER